VANAVAVSLTPRPRLDLTRHTRVALVALPWALPYRPSIQLGLLTSIARSYGFETDSHHAFLDFVALIGAAEYVEICPARSPQLGEWLFSAAAWGDDDPDPDDRLLIDLATEIDPLLAEVDKDRQWLRDVRHRVVPAYLDELVDQTDWGAYGVVGLTSTFQQNASSFAFARRLKQRWPGLVVVLGGANCDGPMGRAWMEGVDWIDHAVTGEGDLAFPALLAAIDEGSDATAVSGVTSRRADGSLVSNPPGPLVHDLDALPVPDYDEFFARAERLGLLPRSRARTVDLPFESSRGCWWGERRHCTFCGLNGSNMHYRSKAPARVLDEVAALTRRYGSFRLEAVDNILDRSYLDTLLRTLTESESDYRFFFEIKANQSRDDVRRLRAAGVHRMQPGIESVSSHVLGLMRKGIRASANVNLLRWATYYGIEVGWNILCGFPGETVADYDEQAELLRALVHLQPPIHCGRIHIDRFSPVFEDRESFEVRDLRPEPSYRYSMPASVDLTNAAYHFQGDLVGSLPDSAYAGTDAVVAEWKKLHDDDPQPTLTASWTSGLVHIDDARDPASPITHVIEGAVAELYLACFDEPRTAGALRTELGIEAPLDDVEAALDRLCDRRLMLRDGNLFLALALPATPAC
jgi:ribosomal peptide maturation radical SAM protein 1